MKMGQSTPRAVMTSCWNQVVTTCELEEGDIVLFSFEEAPGGELQLLVFNIPQYF